MKIYLEESDGERTGAILDVRSWKRGMFCKVYRPNDDSPVVVKTCNIDCHQMSMFREIADDSLSAHIPRTIELGYARINRIEVGVYQQPLYFPYTGHPDGKKLIALQRELLKAETYTQRSDRYAYSPLNMYRGAEFVELCQEAGVSESVCEALDVVQSWAGNYGGQLRWEFSPRNLALDEAGNLVLLDVLFDPEETRKIRAKGRS